MSIASSDVLPEGYQLHWYKIKSILGRGGFGITYLALDENLDQLVAIKEYLPTDVASRNSDQTVHPSTGEKHELYCWGLERFLKEGKILAKFKHPNIIRVLSVFEKNNTAYMVMEFEQGKDLSTLSKKGRSFEEDELLHLFISVIDGLTQVHNHGFIHRDIKPANIYIREADSSAVLLDFGAARLATEKKTQAFTRFITYGYAPLEQYQEGNSKQGSWTDIYSLGATLYFLITGRLPQDALRRGSDLYDSGIDSYEPLTQIAAGKYSENFLLAIDNALMFRIQERPENLLIWRAMLLGETTPNPLPESMTATHSENDKTVLFSDHKKKPQNQPVLYQSADSALENDKTVFMPRRKKKRPQNQLALYQSPKIVDALPDFSFLPSAKKPWILASIVTGIATVIMGLTLFSTESTSSPPQKISQQEVIHNNEQTEKAQHIAMLIRQAEESFFAERIISPLESSATYLYKKVLALEPANQEAINGINNILTYYRTQITKSIAEQEENKADKYIQIIEAIEPGSIIAFNMRLKMQNAKQQREQEKNLANERQNQKNNEERIKQVEALLIEAERYYSSSNISIPRGKSAFDSYKKVLELAPSNKNALQGIEKILFFYERRFNIYLADNDAINTAHIVNIMERIAPNAAVTQQLRTDHMSYQKKLIDKEKLIDKQESADKEERGDEKKLVAKKELTDKEKNLDEIQLRKAIKYNKILESDPTNKSAQQEIEKIIFFYELKFERSIANNDVKSASSTMTILEKIAPNSSVTKRLRIEHSPVTPPPQKQTIAALEIEKIIGFYETKFNTYVANNDLKNAAQIVDVMEKISPNSSVIKRMRTDVAQALSSQSVSP